MKCAEFLQNIEYSLKNQRLSYIQCELIMENYSISQENFARLKSWFGNSVGRYAFTRLYFHEKYPSAKQSIDEKIELIAIYDRLLDLHNFRLLDFTQIAGWVEQSTASLLAVDPCRNKINNIFIQNFYHDYIDPLPDINMPNHILEYAKHVSKLYSSPMTTSSDKLGTGLSVYYSSVVGKSRSVHELAKNHFVIEICLRDRNDVAFPLRTPYVADLILDTITKDIHWHYFMLSLF
jgi:hypothetical protein